MEENLENLNIVPEVIPKSKRRIFLKITLILFLLIGVLVFFYRAEYYLPQNNLESITVIKIDRGDSIGIAGQKLLEAKLIQNIIAFNFYFKIHSSSLTIKPGSYHIAPKLSMVEMIDIITGKFAEAGGLAATIPEGFSLSQIQDRLIGLGLGAQDLVKLKVKNFSSKYSFLSSVPSQASLEGFLFPDTYRFFVDATSSEIADTMLQNFDKKFPTNVRDSITKQNKTVYQIIIMASMIEKEAKTSADMQIISGILWKRLSLGMPLQVDATVAYALNKSGQALTLQDLRYNSPYNTYLYRGLPKGPISNPGIQAILAAVFPRETNYLYYLSMPDGTIVYSTTLEEHNIAKFNMLRSKNGQ